MSMYWNETFSKNSQGNYNIVNISLLCCSFCGWYCEIPSVQLHLKWCKWAQKKCQSWRSCPDCYTLIAGYTLNLTPGIFPLVLNRLLSELTLHCSTLMNTSISQPNIMKHICRFCTNTEAGIIILTRKAICFRTERDTTLLWSIDYIVWQAGCIAWWIVSHYISSLSLSELLVPLHRAELHTAGHQTTAHRQRILNVERNNVALFNYWNAVLNICACPFC